MSLVCCNAKMGCDKQNVLGRTEAPFHDRACPQINSMEVVAVVPVVHKLHLKGRGGTLYSRTHTHTRTHENRLPSRS